MGLARPCSPSFLARQERDAALKNLAAHFMIKRFANHWEAIITPMSSTEEYLRNLGVSALIETIPTGISIKYYEHWPPRQVQAL